MSDEVTTAGNGAMIRIENGGLIWKKWKIE
jgi:hypothetical protein